MIFITIVSCLGLALTLKKWYHLETFYFLYRLPENGQTSGRNMQQAVVYTNISLVGILLVLLLYYIHSINARVMNHAKLAFNPLKYSGIWMCRQLSH